jgi:L-ascorbate 6-phosphate lactonase
MTGSAVTLTWFGQAGFVLGSRSGKSAGIDLFLSPHEMRLYPPPTLDTLGNSLDVLAITHEHRDHLDVDLLPRLAQRYPRLEVIVPAPVAPMVAPLVPTTPVHGLRPGRSRRYGDIQVHAVRAIHAVTMPEGYHDGGAEPRFVGYVLQLDNGPTLYHSGDTLMSVEMIEQLLTFGVDVALLPVNGRDFAREAKGVVGNMTAIEAVRTAAAIGARTLVPMHHDLVYGNTENAGLCAEIVRREGIPLHVLNLAPLVPYVLG